MKNTLREHRLLFLAGSLSAVAYGYLASSSQQYGDVGLWELYSVSGFCAGLSFLVWYHYWQKRSEVPIVALLGFAVLFRALGISTFPLLEDDMYRFLWDGMMTIERGTPYGFIPVDFFESTQINDHFSEILGKVNNPNIATIYGPVCQILFAVCYLIAPGEIWPLQLALGFADLGLITVLLMLAKPNNVLLYAWSPLIIKEFVITAHPDVLGTLFLMMGYLAYQRKYFISVGVLMALAAGVKLFALMLIPLLLGFCFRAWFAFATTLLVLGLPWGFFDAWFPQGLNAMRSDEWIFNAPLYLLLDSWMAIHTLKISLLACLAIGCAMYYQNMMRRWQQMTIRGDLLFLALFVCIPALNAWYLVWLLPFAVIYPSLWAWTASFSIFLAYSTGINLEDSELRSYQHHAIVVAIEFTVIAVAFLIQGKLRNALQSVNLSSRDGNSGSK